MSKTTFSVVMLLSLSELGCHANTDEEPIEGMVCASRTEIIGSYVLGVLPHRDDCDPLEGAKITLAFDKEGKTAIKGFAANSDAKGRYTIPLKGIPRSPTEYGNKYFSWSRRRSSSLLYRKSRSVHVLVISGIRWS